MVSTVSALEDRLGIGPRIAALRERVRVSKRRGEGVLRRDTSVVDARSLQASESEPSWTVRRGLLTRKRLCELTFAFDDLELLIGRPSPAASSDEAVAAAKAVLSAYPLHFRGQTGHCELDLSLLMRVGIDGMVERLQARLKEAKAAQRETYRAFAYALSGFSTMIGNAANTVEAAGPGSPIQRREELRTLALACRRIAHEPPATFLEALQLLWFVLVGVMYADKAALVVPGHLDRILWPFYARDLALGRLTRARALALIEMLYLLINATVRDGLAMSVMVGGRDEEGRDVTNDLSYLCLEALRRTHMIYPTVGVCWHAGTPEALVDLAVELMGKGHPTPAFFGDAIIQRGLQNLGGPPAQACHYINSTCVEITPSGASNVWVASPYYNTCGLLLKEIAAQSESPSPTFDDFVGRYQRRLADAIDEGVAQQNAWRRERQRWMRRPLQSVFTRDCIERGRDLEEGGARYNWIECSFIGLANLADALFVIREEVYHHKRMSLADMKAILDADFEGFEAIRQRFLNGYPKYGQDVAEVDALVADTMTFISETCSTFSVVPDGSPYVPGAFAWIKHEQLGRETGATPDGRKAGFPFADGCGPAQGRETRGPTAAVLSVTCWDHSRMIGGLAMNLKFNGALFDSAEGFESLKRLLLTYLARGGFEVQVNVVDGQTLKDARAHPEQYRDLIVRIGGYSDYFTRLSSEMQDELIQRTEYAHF
jgi:trans-4-hydroxy-L-proline dehydratase